MGAAVNGSKKETAAINHEGMAKILKKHYNSTTLSNLMKPCNLLNKEESVKSLDGMPVVDFDMAKPTLDFCKQNNIQMRGHVLVWHNQTPKWFFCEDFDDSKPFVNAETMNKRLESYIKQCIEYVQTNYRGVVYCWDVVNEAVNDGGTNENPSCSWNCRNNNNNWYTIMGSSYVEKAFEYADKYADDDVSLIYNDYNVFQPEKRDNIIRLIKELRNKNINVGVGLQPTVLLDYPQQLKGNDNDSFETCLRKFGELGIEIQITELSFEIRTQYGEERNAANLLVQANRYQEMFELLLQLDSDNNGPCNITSVTVFGICDDYPLYKDYSQCLYLWDKYCEPKEAFYRIRDVGINYRNNH